MAEEKASTNISTAVQSFSGFFEQTYRKQIQKQLGTNHLIRIKKIRPYIDQKDGIRVDTDCLTEDGESTVCCQMNVSNGAFAFCTMCAIRGGYKSEGIPYDQNLIPMMNFAEMEKYAETILKKYYPNSDRFFMVVDPSSLAGHLGLKVMRKRIDPDSGILGKLFFSKTRIFYYEGQTKTGFETVDPGTIVVNRNPDESLKPEMERFTIAHECAHWILHRAAFTFLHLTGVNTIEEAFRRCTPKGSESENPLIDRMERQANGLAARILMPAWSTLAYAEMVPSKDLYKNPRYQAELSVNKVAESLEVSKQAAKIRLMELQYTNASLAYPGLEKQDLTIEIHPADAMRIYKQNDRFRQLLSTGLYVYTEERFVRSNIQYLSRGNDGNLHVKGDEPQACLRFRYTRKAAYDAEGALRAYVLEPGYVPEREIDVNAFQKRMSDINKVKRTLPHDFGDALSWYMKRQNLTIERLAERSGLSTATINRCKQVKQEIVPIETAMALCVGLRLPGILCLDFLFKGGHVLRDTETDLAYRMILDSMTANSIHEVNRVLIGMRLKPLTKTKSA